MARGTRTAPPPGTWTHALCACAEDPTLACSICWCQCNAAGQMYARTTSNAPNRARVCLAVSGGLWVLAILSYGLSQSSNVLARMAIDTECTLWGYCQDVVDWDQVAAAYVLAIFGCISGIALSALCITVVCTSRRRLRARDAIPPNDCEDCCVGYWCACCALVQMFRQERIGGGSYAACSATGEVDAV